MDKLGDLFVYPLALGGIFCLKLGEGLVVGSLLALLHCAEISGCGGAVSEQSVNK